MDSDGMSLPDTLSQFLIWVIAIVLLLIAGFLFAAVYRRIAQARQYRRLDRLRTECAAEIREAIDRGAAPEIPRRFAFPPNSPGWKAVEDVLFALCDEPGYESRAAALFPQLGYVDHYENLLRKRNVIVRSLAIDKLGRMRFAASTDRLLPLLSARNAEIVGNTVRALGKIGSLSGLEEILVRMDALLSNGLVSRKLLETSLLKFGNAAIPLLVRAAEADRNPVSRGSLLEVLSRLSAAEGVSVAARLLGDPNPEIRAKALKLVAIPGAGMEDAHRARVASLLDDPVWFVRLQAAKTLGAAGAAGFADKLGDRLMDANWQVRNAAATALTRFGNPAIPVFLATLEHTDRYAKESVCEEIEKTGFVDLLVANLADRESGVYERSKRILAIMAALNYRTPHAECLKTPLPDHVRSDIERMMAQEACA